MLQPKRTKYKKIQKGRIKGLSYKGSSLSFGDFGIKALESTWITSRQIEATRIVLSRNVKKNGKIWIRIFPNKPITKKPAEVRMGKGKGPVEHWVSVVKPGKIMFEINGVTMEAAKKTIKLASQKLPIKTKFVTKKEYKYVK